jgi:uncharacterized membrane protein YhhN
MLAFAVADWIAAWRGWDQVHWLTKPVTLLLLIAWFTQMGGWRPGLLWFGVGLVFALLGDVLLLFSARFFLAGLAAFFLAHIVYVVGFLQMPFPLDWRMLPAFLLVVAISVPLLKRIRAGIRARGENGMLVPASLYASVLSLMWLLALSTLFRPGWTEPPSLLVSMGAGLFFLSDTVLAFHRFVRPMPAHELIVMVTYHIGQILIALGAVWQYAGIFG